MDSLKGIQRNYLGKQTVLMSSYPIHHHAERSPTNYEVAQVDKVMDEIHALSITLNHVSSNLPWNNQKKNERISHMSMIERKMLSKIHDNGTTVLGVSVRVLNQENLLTL